MHDIGRNGKPHLVTLVLLTCLCGGLCLGQAKKASTPATPSASETEVKVGLGVEDLNVTGAADSFEIAPDTKIYAWGRVTGVAAGSNVTVAFKKGDKAAHSKEIPVPSVPYRLYAFKVFHKGEEGDWTAVFTGPDGKELGSASFKVAFK